MVFRAGGEVATTAALRRTATLWCAFAVVRAASGVHEQPCRERFAMHSLAQVAGLVCATTTAGVVVSGVRAW